MNLNTFSGMVMVCLSLATSGSNTKNLIGPILFLYYEESLVSSNLNSKLVRFHYVRPNVSIKIESYFTAKLFLVNIELIQILIVLLRQMVENAALQKFPEVSKKSSFTNPIPKRALKMI